MSLINDLATGVAYNRTLQETTGFFINLPYPNWSKFGNKRSCDTWKCPSDNFFKQINIQGCTCMTNGTSIWTIISSSSFFFVCSLPHHRFSHSHTHTITPLFYPFALSPLFIYKKINE